MNVWRVVLFGFISTAAFILGRCASLPTGGERPPDSFIEFYSAPDKVVDGSVVRVRYRCSRPCRLTAEALVSTLRRTDLLVFRRTWINRTPGVYRIQRVALRWPAALLYQHGLSSRNVLEAGNVTVCVRLDRLKGSSEPETNHDSTLRVSKVLQMMPVSERPAAPPTESLSWITQLLWQTSRDRISQCPYESDIINVLSFPLASTGEHFGAVRRFRPFTDGGLERARLRAVTQPSVSVSVWIYLLKWCHRKLCGIIHHMDGRNSYNSVLIQLKDTGNVIIQARVTTGEDEAFQVSAALPLRKWIRLDCSILDSQLEDPERFLPSWKTPDDCSVLLHVTLDDETRTYFYNFQNSIHYDDTDGYFVIGGSRYMPGIHGYFGPIKYYRLGTEEIKNQLRPDTTLQELDKTHRECQEMKAFTEAFLTEVTESHAVSTISRGVSTPRFIRLRRQSDEQICRQTWSWETPCKYNTLFRLLQTHADQLRTGSQGVKVLGTTLFKEATDEMFVADPMQVNVSSKSTSLLQASSCFGNHKASLLLASIHLSGLGHTVNQTQGHVYSLIGASGDDRFALMHAGYKHTQGIDGFPKDMDVACSYYSNAGAQSSIDSNNIHTKKQYTPEHIYLSSQEDLDSVTSETSDDFEYLKFLADRGDVESQRRLGTMLYWGLNGISKDPASAIKWMERSSMQMKDPSAMYDYSILLMKGQGVKRNSSRGLQLMKKAAAMGCVNALNGLGWYHSLVLHDHSNAVKYFEAAALNGSGEAMFNLGVYHLTGRNPRSPQRNETAAFQHFLNASRFGHVAGSVEAAWYLSTGNLAGVSQDAARAVTLLKKVCEQNGHLGFMIRQALQAYLRGSRPEAFVEYVLAAETGLGLAQSNAAHLCEELHLGDDCQWRYHNHSVLNFDPHPSALLKMGDHYYDYYCDSRSTPEDSLSVLGQAVSMYSRAALAGSPQGMYNLVVLAQRGHAPPRSIHAFINVSHDGGDHDDEDAVVEKMLSRCVQMEPEEAITPCSLALLGVQMGKALRRMTGSAAQLVLAYAALLSVCVLMVVLPLHSCLEQRASRLRAAALRGHTTPASQDGVGLTSGQDGIMGTDGVSGNVWLTVLNGERWLGQTGDLAVTLSGVCLCVFSTTFLYHLLRHTTLSALTQ